ncbi:MAG: hypothetical protein E7329_12645 [Clostridiales bacterium]|nr:hypothetical protein [Clostridiales bacterium]
MRKRFFAILLVLCLLPLGAQADFDPGKLNRFSRNPLLQDMKAYASAQLKEGNIKTESYLIYQQYSGKPSTVAAVAEAYAQLLLDKFGCELEKKFTVDCGNYARTGYAFSCDYAIDLSQFHVYGEEDDGRNWDSGDCNIFVQYTIPDSGTSYIHFYYSPEFTCKDEGYRYVMETGGSEKVIVNSFTTKTTPKPTARPTEKPDANTSATK